MLMKGGGGVSQNIRMANRERGGGGLKTIQFG